MARSSVIQGWFAVLLLAVVLGTALGAPVTLGMGILLLGLSLVPPAIVLMLRPPPTCSTGADFAYRSDQRG